jgi:hypothetical protein
MAVLFLQLGQITFLFRVMNSWFCREKFRAALQRLRVLESHPMLQVGSHLRREPGA